MSAQTKAVEEGIKIALDAADAATNVTDEFARIKQDYAAVEGEVQKLYKNAVIVFASSAVASILAVVVAAMMYYRTIETMETSNNTSLEALVIFAENVDKLALATSSLDDAMTKQSELADEIAVAKEMIAEIEAQQAEANSATSEGLMSLSEMTTSAVGQLSETMVAKFDNDLVGYTQEIKDMLMALNTAQSELIEMMQSQEMGADKLTPGPELNAKIENVLMLQKEISAKITATNSPPPKSRSRPSTTPPRTTPVRRTDPPISFP